MVLNRWAQRRYCKRDWALLLRWLKARCSQWLVNRNDCAENGSVVAAQMVNVGTIYTVTPSSMACPSCIMVFDGQGVIDVRRYAFAVICSLLIFPYFDFFDYIDCLCSHRLAV